MRKLIGASEAAALLRVSRQAINAARAAGRIAYADSERRLYDPAALEAAWHANRQRKRTPRPRADADTPAGEHDSVPILAKRKLKAEVSILERKAATGPDGVVEVAAIERGLRAALVAQRGVLDSLHPRILEGVTDQFCAPGHPQYAEMFAALHGALRNTWADSWQVLSGAIASEAPELRMALLRVAAWHNGPDSAAARLLREGDA